MSPFLCLDFFFSFGPIQTLLLSSLPLPGIEICGPWMCILLVLCLITQGMLDFQQFQRQSLGLCYPKCTWTKIPRTPVSLSETWNPVPYPNLGIRTCILTGLPCCSCASLRVVAHAHLPGPLQTPALHGSISRGSMSHREGLSPHLEPWLLLCAPAAERGTCSAAEHKHPVKVLVCVDKPPRLNSQLFTGTMPFFF